MRRLLACLATRTLVVRQRPAVRMSEVDCKQSALTLRCDLCVRSPGAGDNSTPAAFWHHPWNERFLLTRRSPPTYMYLHDAHMRKPGKVS